MLESYGIRDCRSTNTLQSYTFHTLGPLIHSSVNLSYYIKILLIFNNFSILLLLRYRHFFVYQTYITQFFFSEKDAYCINIFV